MTVLLSTEWKPGVVELSEHFGLMQAHAQASAVAVEAHRGRAKEWLPDQATKDGTKMSDQASWNLHGYFLSVSDEMRWPRV
jgi:hypothetical protein